MFNQGIYAIYNTANDKLYIGSAVSMSRRFNSHKSHLERGIHQSPHLQSAWTKHGSEAFEFSCLETVDCKTKLVEREQAWLDALRPWDRLRGYNTSPTAGNCLGIRHTAQSRANMAASRIGKKRSVETKAKMRAAHLGKKFSDEHRAKLRARTCPAETRARIAATLRGRKASEETRAKMSLSGKGRIFTAEHRAKIGLARLGKKHTDEAKAKCRGYAGRGMAVNPLTARRWPWRLVLNRARPVYNALGPVLPG